MAKRMTVQNLAERMIEHFGPVGASAHAYERYLHVRKGTLPKTLSRFKVSEKRFRYDPYAVAEWYLRDRRTGGNWIEA
jgi:hypothetical protein